MKKLLILFTVFASCFAAQQISAQNKNFESIISVEVAEQNVFIENVPVYEVPASRTAAEKTNKRFVFIVQSLDRQMSYTGFLYARKIGRDRFELDVLIEVFTEAFCCVREKLIISADKPAEINLSCGLKLTASHKLIEKGKIAKLKKVSDVRKIMEKCPVKK